MAIVGSYFSCPGWAVAVVYIFVLPSTKYGCETGWYAASTGTGADSFMGTTGAEL
jgi:hypothetical protein